MALLQRGASLTRKSVRHFFRTREFFNDFRENKGFLPKVYEIFGSEMPLGFYGIFGSVSTNL